VTIAGIVFGLTMVALLTSSVLSIAQIGTTITVGLLLDTLIVRVFIVPAIVALLGRWFWWPRPFTQRTKTTAKWPQPDITGLPRPREA
jgi:putative drug exporter of the RND superfamily